jgi:hypothetical protein
MTISEFEHGKTRIMTEASDALRRVGIDYHSIQFDLHGEHPHPKGSTLTVTAEGRSATAWFSADEIETSSDCVVRAAVRQKIAALVSGMREAVT